MSESDDRQVAWALQMQRVHDRLRAALRLSRTSLADGGPPEGVDVLLYCWGFCAALDGHHRAEDDALFPAVLRTRPDLADVLRNLRQDHSMIEHLLAGLRSAVENKAGPEVLRQHLDGVGSIMESHFRYEERTLLGPLVDVELEGPVERGLGPLT